MCASTALERTILPIPDRTPLGPPSYDAKESGADHIEVWGTGSAMREFQ